MDPRERRRYYQTRSTSSAATLHPRHARATSTVKPTTRRYYAELKAEYAVKIRQLVPRYDEMVGHILELLDARAPQSVLDIGAGIGNVSVQLLERLPGARVTAVEPSDDMHDEARKRLGPFGDRVELVKRDIRDFSPGRRYDAIFSNLVLHNIGLDDKRRVLRLCGEWLEPGGCLIWGDLIRHTDPQTQAAFVERRKAHARERGCPEALIRLNFEKESRDDHPLTVDETRAEGRRAGFGQVRLIWAHHAFAIFLLADQPPSR